MAPEAPLMAEWTRGSAGVASGMSIGFAPESGVAIHQNVSPTNRSQQVASLGNPPSQYATIHINTKTASIAGASIGYPVLAKQQRSSSEGTVQVVVANKQQAAMSSAAAVDADAREEDQMDSLSAVSKAAMEDRNATHENGNYVGKGPFDGTEEDQGEGEHENKQDDRQQYEKPTESLSSAAAGMNPGYAAAIATAASLVSQNTGGRALLRDERLDAILPKSISSEIPVDTNDALNAAIPHSGNQLNFGSTTKTQGNVANWIPSRVAQATAPAQGNSSNSGTHGKDAEGSLSVKRKANSRPPMLPPPAQVGVTRGVSIPHHVLPTGSSAAGGIVSVQLELAHMAEDAVSTVQQPHEMLGEIVCDAVSKASGEDEEGFTESRVCEEGLSAQEENSIMRSTTRHARKKKKA